MKILIIGAGDIGYQLSKRMAPQNNDITIVDADATRAQRVREQVDAIVVEGHGSSASVLEEAGVRDADVVAALTDNDEVNLIACRIARKAGVDTTICRVRNPEYMHPDYMLSPQELGVDHFIHPEKETADRIVQLIRQSSATDVIDFEDGKIQLVGVRLEEDSKLVRKPLVELVREFDDPPMRIVAIVRNQTTMIPGGDDEMLPGDHIFGACDPEYVSTFISLTGKKDLDINNVMILGGGLVGLFVARELSKDINVKVVESNIDRSREIATSLPDTLVIHGDGTDIDLMAVEGLMDMDAFVAVTGDDETNIISTLLARHLRVPRTIALVNKIEYLPITSTIGMDAVVSKQLLTVNAVHHLIISKEVAQIASIPGVDAQIIEYIVEKGDRITKKPLKEIKFPRNAIVGAILRDEKFIIPRGDEQLSPGDRVVVFSLPSALHDVDKLFK